MVLEDKILRWTPNENQTGVHVIVIEVRDGDDMTDTQILKQNE